MKILIALLIVLLDTTLAVDLVPIKEYACGQKEQLSRQLVLQFDSPDSVSRLMERKSRVSALEEVVLDTYNQLSFQSCDLPHFRELTGASVIDLSDAGDSEDFYQFYQENYFLILQLEGRCRNCTENLPMFDHPKPSIPPQATMVNGTNSTIFSTATDVPIHTTTSEASVSFSLSKTTRQENRNQCICPAVTSPASISIDASSTPELTIMEFMTLLNTNMANELQPSANLTVTNMVELQEVECSASVRKFTSFAYLDVELVNNKPPSTREVQALESSFKDAYNRLSFGSCDPYFRSVLEAKLEIKIDGDGDDYYRRRYGAPRWDTNTSSIWGNVTGANTSATWGNLTGNETKEEPRREAGNAVFTIQGECRNCPVNSAGSFTLFDDAFRRRRRGRRLQRKQKAAPFINSLHPLWHTKFPMGELHRYLEATRARSCVCPGQTTSTEERPTISEANDDLDGDGEEEEYVAFDDTEGDTDDGDVSNEEGIDPAHSLSAVEVTQEDFLASYNMELEQLQEEGTVETVHIASDLEEGQNVECSAERQMFTSEIFSDLKVDLFSVSKEEVQSLERAFLDTYNELGFRTCDGHFRTVEDVELRIAPVPGDGNIRARRLRDILDERDNRSTNNASSTSPTSTSASNITNSTNITSSNAPLEVDEPRREVVPTLFAVTGECRNCPVSETGNFNLFDDAFRRRKLELASDMFGQDKLSFLHRYSHFEGTIPHSGSAFRRNGDKAVCTCLAGEDPAVGEGPTTETFGAVLSEEVVHLDKAGKIDSVQGEVGSILEGTQVTCNGEVQDFTSYIYTDLGIQASQVTNRAKERMEKAFLDTYNGLSFQACDEFFRVVSEVGLVLSDELDTSKGSRHLQAGENATRAPAANAAYFQVTGRCRNCRVSTTGGFALFDDSFRRRSLKERVSLPQNPFQSFPSPGTGRRLQEALDVCLCPQGKSPGEEPPPSTQEFLVEFNTNLIKAQEEEEKAEQEGHQDQEGNDPAADYDGTTTATATAATSSPAVALPVIVIQETAFPPRIFPTNNVTSSPTTVPTFVPTDALTDPPLLRTPSPSTSIPLHTGNVTLPPTPLAVATNPPTPVPVVPPTREPMTRPPLPLPTPTLI